MASDELAVGDERRENTLTKHQAIEKLAAVEPVVAWLAPMTKARERLPPVRRLSPGPAPVDARRDVGGAQGP